MTNFTKSKKNLTAKVAIIVSNLFHYCFTQLSNHSNTIMYSVAKLEVN
jgi:hypothetical protein